MVWKADAKGRLQQNPLHQHHIQEPLKIMLYRPIPPPDPNKYVINVFKTCMYTQMASLLNFSPTVSIN